MNANDKRAQVEEILKTKYQKDGFLLEDDIIDICIDYDLDLVEIDSLCEKLLSKKMIVRDSSNVEKINETDDEYIVDRSHLDYNLLFERIRKEYPNFSPVIDVIREIKPPQSREWQLLIGEAKNGNVYAKERMILMYLRSVLNLAYNFSKTYYCDFEEAFQNGVIGLMNAINKYDLTSPDRFPAYFSLWVMQSMHRFAYTKGSIVRFPVHYKDRMNIVISKVCSILENDDFEESLAIVEHDFGKNLLEEYSINKSHLLPYTQLSEEIIVDIDCFKGVFDELEKNEAEKLLDILKPKEREVIELRYGLKDGVSKTLEDVGSLYSVTRERIRQIEAKGMRKLKNHLKPRL